MTNISVSSKILLKQLAAIQANFKGVATYLYKMGQEIDLGYEMYEGVEDINLCFKQIEKALTEEPVKAEPKPREQTLGEILEEALNKTKAEKQAAKPKNFWDDDDNIITEICNAIKKGE